MKAHSLTPVPTSATIAPGRSVSGPARLAILYFVMASSLSFLLPSLSLLSEPYQDHFFVAVFSHLAGPNAPLVLFCLSQIMWPRKPCLLCSGLSALHSSPILTSPVLAFPLKVLFCALFTVSSSVTQPTVLRLLRKPGNRIGQRGVPEERSSPSKRCIVLCGLSQLQGAFREIYSASRLWPSCPYCRS